jgi:hypothetical protein
LWLRGKDKGERGSLSVVRFPLVSRVVFRGPL